MKSLVFETHKLRYKSFCTRCGDDLPRETHAIRQGTLCFHPKCFEEHLTEQAARYKQALTRLKGKA